MLIDVQFCKFLQMFYTTIFITLLAVCFIFLIVNYWTHCAISCRLNCIVGWWLNCIVNRWLDWLDTDFIAILFACLCYLLMRLGCTSFYVGLHCRLHVLLIADFIFYISNCSPHFTTVNHCHHCLYYFLSIMVYKTYLPTSHAVQDDPEGPPH